MILSLQLQLPFTLEARLCWGEGVKQFDCQNFSTISIYKTMNLDNLILYE